MTGAWDRISMFWGERKIGEETYLHVNLLSPNGAARISKPPPIGLEMGWDPRILGGTKERKRQQFSTCFTLGVFACLSKWPKWNYFFCIDFPFFPFFYIISYSPAMAGAWDRISMFWGERKIVEETYLHLKLLSPNGGRARVHYIEFKVLEKITETLSMAEGILWGFWRRLVLEEWMGSGVWH